MSCVSVKLPIKFELVIYFVLSQTLFFLKTFHSLQGISKLTTSMLTVCTPLLCFQAAD